MPPTSLHEAVSDRGSGRKRGGVNKITRDMREAILEAFSIVGGVQYLCKVAADDPKAFCALLGKVIPVKLEGGEDNPVVMRVAIDRPPQETREQWLARRSRELGVTAAAATTTLVTATRVANGRDNDH